LDQFFSQMSYRQIFMISTVSLVVLGLTDYVTGTALSFSVFYIAPIFLSSWYIDRKVGYFMAAMSASVWMLADVFSHSTETAAYIHIWNTMVRFAFFAVATFMLSVIKDKLELEQKLADTDPLTNLSNRRHFQEICDAELMRARRYGEPFTVCYIDLDNFKYINDTRGHDVGDDVLREVAKVLRAHLRRTDISARLGGDEFAGLFPVTDFESAKVLINKLHPLLNDAMQHRNWPITFSVGAVSYHQPVHDSRELIRMVDETMYSIKKSGKNSVRHLCWPDDFEKGGRENNVTTFPSFNGRRNKRTD